ncbi:hypothetical protein ABT115_08855 [Streptomyces sp. NPDC001832]|uniref:hypothetical protein n=1 Tax=Streptomyces sp. NPDC001832 TaxID=3154527 RepID=UPI0033262596
MRFQTAWCESTPGETHVTFSGHMTPCDRYVIEAKPVYDSKPEDVTCQECTSRITPAEGEWEQEEDNFWRMSDAKGESIGYVKSEWDSGWDDGQWVFSGEQNAATWYYAYKSLDGLLSSFIDRFLTLDEAKSAVEHA